MMGILAWPILLYCHLVTETHVIKKPGIPNNHCGLHALIAVAAALDKDVSIEQLLDGNQYLSSVKGSSTNDLLRAIDAVGLSGKTISGLNARDLIATTCPLIIPMENDPNSRVQHWIAILGVENNQIAIFDSILGEYLRSPDEINFLWTGNAIIVGKQDSEVNSCATRLKMSAIFRRAFMISLPLLAIVAVNAILTRKGTRNRSLRHRLVSIGLAPVVAWTLVTAYLISGVDARTCNAFLSTRTCWDTNETSDSDSERQKRVSVNGIEFERTLIIDVRTPISFKAGHLPTATNVPINSGMSCWAKLVEDSKNFDSVVVYCQSNQCEWADEAQKRLRCLGISSSVIDGGYRAYVITKEQQRNDLNAHFNTAR